VDLNHAFRLARRPIGLPGPETWSYVEEPIPTPADGEMLVRVLYISLDPAMRGWMNDARSYMPPVSLGEVMRAVALGRVVATRHPGFQVGDQVSGLFGVQEYALSNGTGVTPVDTALAPLPAHLNALGVAGMTAYFGLLDVGRPDAGETVVVSAAAGSVGQLVGQIARIRGCRVVGIAGGAAKCAHIVKELQFDAAIDYRSENVASALRRECPNRIDVYFDNVGGEILDAALTRLGRGARIVICGAISQYNNADAVRGPSNYLALLVDRARMQGFLVFDYAERYPQAIADMAGWLRAGRLRTREDIVEGLAAFPDALPRLFRGENLGKLMLRVAAEGGEA
jgi:NADPH-dependent curcumin reductase CurA